MDIEKTYFPIWRAISVKLADPRLSDEQAGQIIKAAAAYEIHGFDGKKPETGDLAVDMIITDICGDIDRNREYRKRRSRAGRAGAVGRWGDKSREMTEEEMDAEIDDMFPRLNK
jgi:hypothetical protein